jgi:hypothetical protein
MAPLFDPLAQALTAQASSPQAMQDQQLDELFRTINADRADAQNAQPMSLPFPGMAVRDAPAGGRSAATPAASQQPSTQAPSVDSRFLEGGPQPTSTKRQDRLEPSPLPKTGRLPTVAERTSQQTNAPVPDFNPSFGERLTNFGNALTSQGTVTNFAEQQQQRQSTFKMLRNLGFDDDSAKAAALNPDILKSVLASKYKTGAGAFGKQVVWGYDEEGNWVPLQVSSQGIGARTQLPPGVRAVPPGDIAQQQGYGKAFGTEQGKIQADKPTAQARAQDAFSKINTNIEMVNNLLKHPGLDAAVGPISQYLPNVQKETANFETDLDTLQTRLFVSAINSMRELSKTGGALGSVTEREIELMKNSFRSLTLGQGEANMRQNLQLLTKDLRDSMARIQQAYEQQYGAGQVVPPPATAGGQGQAQTAPVRVQSPEEAWRLPSGTLFETPDGQQKVRP